MKITLPPLTVSPQPASPPTATELITDPLAGQAGYRVQTDITSGSGTCSGAFEHWDDVQKKCVEVRRR